jgi:hypothetical protein
MKVYALIRDFPYEGYKAPEGIYTTREKAEAAKYDIEDGSWWIIEYIVDED